MSPQIIPKANPLDPYIDEKPLDGKMNVEFTKTGVNKEIIEIEGKFYIYFGFLRKI